MVSYEEWKEDVLQEIEQAAHTTEKGNAFVQFVLKSYLNLAEHEAEMATEYSGANDKGIDAFYSNGSEKEPYAIVVQGKYGTAGKGASIYQETQKFFLAIQESSLQGQKTTPTIQKIAEIMKLGGTIRYIIATSGELRPSQKKEIANAKILAKEYFQSSMQVEEVTLKGIYHILSTENARITIHLPCKFLPVTKGVYIGAAKVSDIYQMLSEYRTNLGGTQMSIYDKNIRTYLRRKGTVNKGIYETLEKEPEHFVAYNNGITIICQSAEEVDGETLRLFTPYITNGCQTSGVINDFMAGRISSIAYVAIKVLVAPSLEDEEDEYALNITRFSNRQNALKGKDFISLNTTFKKLKKDLKARGYFLETQTGEYKMLTRKQKSELSVLNAFESMLCYGAGVLGKPHLAFGNSGLFAPEGREFEKVIDMITADDLYYPWEIGQEAIEQFHYVKITPRSTTKKEEHKIQTRYLFIFMYFRLLRNLLFEEKITRAKKKEDVTKEELYHALSLLKKEPLLYMHLLQLTDKIVASHMMAATASLLTENKIFSRNIFLRGTDIIETKEVERSIWREVISYTSSDGRAIGDELRALFEKNA